MDGRAADGRELGSRHRPTEEGDDGYGVVTTTGGTPIGGIEVQLLAGATLKATYTTAADGFYVFYDDMDSRNDDFPAGSVGCAGGAVGTLSVPAASYKAQTIATAAFNSTSLTGNVQATQALRLDLKPPAAP